MVLCRYYQQGYCKFGDNCKFEHSSGYKQTRNDYYRDNTSNYRDYENSYRDNYRDNYNRYSNQQQSDYVDTQNRFSGLRDDYRGNERRNNQNFVRKSNFPHNAPTDSQQTFEDFFKTVIIEIGETPESVTQWPLSYYAPMKDRECYPGLEDISPEELRWEFLNSQLQGNVNEVLLRVAEMIQRQKSILNSIRNRVPEAINNLRTIFEGRNTSSSQLSEKGVFGSPINTESTFRLSKFDNAQTAFQSPSQTNNVFGNSSFGLANQSFGSPNSSSPCGTSNTNSQVFGVSNQSFGSPNTNTNHAFGNSNASQGFGSSFGAAPSFGSPTQSFPVASPSTGGIQQQATFGSPQTQPNSFSSQFSTQQPQQPTATLGQSSFGKQSFSSADSSLYSQMEDLNEEEREQFTSDLFVLGKIPIKPPPKDFC